MPVPVYVYINYNDEYCFGERYIRVYSNLEEVRKELRLDVEEYFEKPWDEIEDTLGDYDSFDEDNVTVNDGTYVHYWIIETHELKERV